MRIGVPKEIKTEEYRVGLTPAAVREYVAQGHQVLVEQSAGHGVGATDDIYARAGAHLADTAEEVFRTADMIVKVKEPQRSEWQWLREGQMLFTYLHLAPDPEQALGLLASGCTAVAYETVREHDGSLPLLAPMSEVAGRLSIEAAALALRRPARGMGKLMGGVPGVPPAKVVVLGGGVVGTHAARMATGLGAEVVILDRSLARLRQLDELFEGRVQTRFATLDARRRVGPGGERTEIDHPRASEKYAAAVRFGRCRDRSGRVLRNIPSDHASGPDLCGRRDRALLRRQYAGRGSDHVKPRVEQRDIAVRTCAGI